jgi:hypothetical protein
MTSQGSAAQHCFLSPADQLLQHTNTQAEHCCKHASAQTLQGQHNEQCKQLRSTALAANPDR